MKLTDITKSEVKEIVGYEYTTNSTEHFVVDYLVLENGDKLNCYGCEVDNPKLGLP